MRKNHGKDVNCVHFEGMGYNAMLPGVPIFGTTSATGLSGSLPFSHYVSNTFLAFFVQMNYFILKSKVAFCSFCTCCTDG